MKQQRWMKRAARVHIDGALENRGHWLGGSMISYIDTIEALEEMME